MQIAQRCNGCYVPDHRLVIISSSSLPRLEGMTNEDKRVKRAQGNG
jgi:hypothetical protein